MDLFFHLFLQVFEVEACIEPVPRSTWQKNTITTATTTQTVDVTAQIHAPASSNMTPAVRERMCKSVSDASDAMTSESQSSRTVTKAASVTLLRKEHDDVTDTSKAMTSLRVDEHTQELTGSNERDLEVKKCDAKRMTSSNASEHRSTRRKLISRLFTRSKKMPSNHAKSSIATQGVHSNGKDATSSQQLCLVPGIEVVVDDVSDSGMASGASALTDATSSSPCLVSRAASRRSNRRRQRNYDVMTSRSFGAADLLPVADAVTSRSRHVTNGCHEQRKQQQQQQTVASHKPLTISRSSSDPSLPLTASKQKTSPHKRAMTSRRSMRNKPLRHHTTLTSSAKHKQQQVRGDVTLQRSRSLRNGGRLPSVEKLDSKSVVTSSSVAKKRGKKNSDATPRLR